MVVMHPGSVLQDILDAGLEAAPLSPARQTAAARTVPPAMLFSMPGGSADLEVSYEEWQNAYHTHHQQRHNVPMPPSGEGGSHGPAQQPPPGSKGVSEQTGPAGRVLEAWGSSDCMQQRPRGELEVGETSGQQGQLQLQSKEEAIKSEW